MDLVQKVYRCYRCGEEFITEGSAIKHDNLLNSWNMNCYISNGDLIKKFKDSNLEERKCAYLWLTENGHEKELKEMQDYFNERL
jgi:uncharacterized C2H2 Zn-finger protein